MIFLPYSAMYDMETEQEELSTRGGAGGWEAPSTRAPGMHSDGVPRTSAMAQQLRHYSGESGAPTRTSQSGRTDTAACCAHFTSSIDNAGGGC